jgi:hypothetical protein
LKQVEVVPTGQAASWTEAEEYDVHEPPDAVKGQPPVAAQGTAGLTVHEALAPGVGDQVPLKQVEVKFAGQVFPKATDEVLFEEQVPPDTVTPHAPDAAQLTAHVDIDTPAGGCVRNEVKSVFKLAGIK